MELVQDGAFSAPLNLFMRRNCVNMPVGAETASEAHHFNMYLLYQLKLNILGMRLSVRENSAKSVPLLTVFLLHYGFHSKVSLLPGRNRAFD